MVFEGLPSEQVHDEPHCVRDEEKGALLKSRKKVVSGLEKLKFSPPRSRFTVVSCCLALWVAGK